MALHAAHFQVPVAEALTDLLGLLGQGDGSVDVVLAEREKSLLQDPVTVGGFLRHLVQQPLGPAHPPLSDGWLELAHVVVG